MSYTALYRKWRPSNFDDVKGQDHIVTTLKNQITANRIGHAYLFCGTRGTGKTTIAKIFARTVNCENPVDGSPCGECASCKAILSGSSMNIMEIDAASNNGVDNIREIKEEVFYPPAEGKYKVYIIDEVHMLSIGAFNALLKTLEEPPSYVIFILATTEANKIPITILSRCQRYDFKRITIDTISDRLKDLMIQEKIEAEDRALRYVAKAADGSMRDALSLLDQCIAFYYGEKLTYEKTLEILGAMDAEVYSDMLRKIMKQDVAGAVHLLETIVMKGCDINQFVTDFTWYFRNLLLVKTSENMEDVLDMAAEAVARLKEEATMIEPTAIMRYIRIFSELSGQIKYAAQKRILLEMTLIRLCKPSMETDTDSLLERIRNLEEKLEKGIVVTGSSESSVNVTNSEIKQPVKKANPKALSGDIKNIVDNWKKFILKFEYPARGFIDQAKKYASADDKLVMVGHDITAHGYIERNKETIESTLGDTIGKSIEIVVPKFESSKSVEDSCLHLEQKILIDIETDTDTEFKGGF